MYGSIRERYELNRRLCRRSKMIVAAVSLLFLVLTMWWLLGGKEKTEAPNNRYYFFRDSEIFFDTLPEDHVLQRFEADNFAFLESCVLYDGDRDPLDYTSFIEIFLDVQDQEMVHYSIHCVLDFDPHTQEKSAMGYARSRPGTYLPETLQLTNILETAVVYREWYSLEGNFEGYQALIMLNDDIYVIISRDLDVHILFSFVEGMLA